MKKEKTLKEHKNFSCYFSAGQFKEINDFALEQDISLGSVVKMILQKERLLDEAFEPRAYKSEKKRNTSDNSKYSHISIAFEKCQYEKLLKASKESGYASLSAMIKFLMLKNKVTTTF